MKQSLIMKKQTFPYKTYLVLAIFLIFSTSALLAKEITREYTGSKPVSANDLISIKTSHCKGMVINTTNDNIASYKMKVIIKADENKTDIVSKILDEIEFSISKGGNEVELDLEWPFRGFSSSSGLWGSKTKITMKNGTKFEYPGKLEVRMVAEINIPKENKLAVAGAHSNIQLGHLSNTLNLKVRHSKFKANDVKGIKLNAAHSKVDMGNAETDANITLSHSKLNGLNITDADISCSHSKVSFLETKDVILSLSHSGANFNNSSNIEISSMQHSRLEINNAGNVKVSSSQHSTIEIEKAKNVVVRNGQHGKISINELNNFEFISGGFTRLHLGTVRESLEINTQHSNISITSMENTIKLVDIENQFASLNLGAAKIDNFDLLVQDGKHTTINKNSTMVKKSDSYFTKRKGDGPVLEINIRCPHCTINIQ